MRERQIIDDARFQVLASGGWWNQQHRKQRRSWQLRWGRHRCPLWRRECRTYNSVINKSMLMWLCLYTPLVSKNHIFVHLGVSPVSKIPSFKLCIINQACRCQKCVLLSIFSTAPVISAITLPIFTITYTLISVST